MTDISLTPYQFCDMLVIIIVKYFIRSMNMRCHLSTLMGQARYSIQDVHNKTGLARSTVAQLYHDNATRVDFETIEKLCALFNCNISTLFELEGVKNNETNS